MNSTIQAKGAVRAELLKESGELVIYEFNNLVVNVGLGFIAQSMRKTTTNSPAAMTHMALGTGNSAPVGGNTSLDTQVGTRENVSTAGATVNVSNDTVEYTAHFLAGNATGSITEAGIFNAASGGDMLCRATFTAIPKGAGDSLTMIWKVTIQ